MMVLAHLRGLLKPDYQHGLRSRIRENVVLIALAREVDAESLGRRAVMEASCMSAVNPASRVKLHRDAMSLLNDSCQMAKLLDYDAIEAKRPKLENERDVQDLMKAFEILRQTDVFDKMEQICRSI